MKKIIEKKEPFEVTHMHTITYILGQYACIETLKTHFYLIPNFRVNSAIKCPEYDNMLYHITYLSNKSQGLNL